MKPDRAGQAWLDALPDPIVAIDPEGRLEWANCAASALFGLSLAEFEGRCVLDLIHPEDLHFALMSLESVQSKEVGTHIEIRVATPSGWRLVELIGANRMGQPGIDTLLISLRNLTERRRWEVGRSDDALFRAVVHNAAIILMLVGSDGRIGAISGAVARLLGRDPETLEGTSLHDLVHDEDRAAVARALAHCRTQPIGETEPVTVEAGLLDGNGRAIPFELTLVNMAGDPTVEGIVVSAHNITKLRAFQRALSDLARRDPLTMLANRTAVDDRLEKVLGSHRSVTVAFVDLDGFKALNDRNGHHFGDLVLRAVAERLSATVRPSDLVARYGGDEFVVVGEDMARPGELRQRLAEAMALPVYVDGREVAVRASIGEARSAPGDTPTTLLMRADQAMYRRKGRPAVSRAAS